MSKKSDKKNRRSGDAAISAAVTPYSTGAALQLVAPMLRQGLQFHQQGQWQQAQSLYDAVLNIDGTNFDALHLRGVVASDRGDHESAVRFIGRALSLRPGAIAACQNMGVALRSLKRFEDALAIYKRAIALDPDNPQLLNNNANVLVDVGRYAEALTGYERAIALDPRFVDAYDGRGNALREMHRFEESLSSYAQAQLISPDAASAHWNEGLCRLLSGDLAAGWEKYEWGWRVGTRGRLRSFAQPLWLGKEPLHDRTILLYAEQGFGDTIHFCRYVREVAALGARVILEVQPALKTLLRGLEGAEQVIACGDPLPDFDYRCPLLSLPLALKTELASIPSARSYLEADPALVEKWTTRLGPFKGLRIGIAWSGNPQHSRNHQRSISLEDMLRLRVNDIQLFSLQKDLNATERESLAGCADVMHFGEDFANTAALASLMDIVISVDTSIAHLSAALGRPTWILLLHTPDWRWMLNRDDSPWYPTARLFRQSAINDWTTVIDAVRQALHSVRQLPSSRPLAAQEEK